MEEKLRRLFDYQKFAQNRNLQRVINAVDEKYERGIELISDTALSFAVGGKEITKRKTDETAIPVLKKDEKK